MQPKFSVIIPVYNVAPYLRECLDSVLAQTVSEWEAICIDDGSSDGSSVILDEYAERDPRFVVVHQKNAGVSVARNRGLDFVRGDYFLFLDSDDMVESDYIKHLYELVDGSSDSVGAVGARYFNGNDTIEFLRPRSGKFSTRGIGIRLHTGGVINKLFPICCLRGLNKQYFFDGLCFGEDAVFLLRILAYCDEIIVDGNYLGYNYRVRSNSLCHGHSAVEVSKRYWDDVIALDDSNEGKKDRYLVREFMYFCVLSHAISLSKVSECEEYLNYIKKNKYLWRLLIDLKHRNEDMIYHPEYETFSKIYPRIIMLGLPISIKAYMLISARLMCKAINKLGRIAHLKK